MGTKRRNQNAKPTDLLAARPRACSGGALLHAALAAVLISSLPMSETQAMPTASPAHGAIPPTPPPVGSMPVGGGGGPIGPVGPARPAPTAGPVGPATPGPGSPGQSGPIPSTGPSTGGGNDVDMTSWTLWWEMNKAPYLQLKANIYAGAPTSGSAEFFLGRGQTPRVEHNALRPSESDIEDRILPALLAALKSSRSNDVTTGSLIALARIGQDLGDARKKEIDAALREHLGSSSQEVSETAAIALGILGSRDSVFLLGDILLDKESVREALGASPSTRTRAFAAYALGFLGRQSEIEDLRRLAVQRLAQALEEDESPAQDVRAACVLALGILPLAPSGVVRVDEGEEAAMPPAASREAQVLYLLGILEDEKVQRVVRAQAPLSIGRLLAAEPPLPNDGLKRRVLRTFLKRLGAGGEEPNEVLRSLAIALGMIADNDGEELDDRARVALFGFPRLTGDRLARNLALMSLARIGSRPGQSEASGVASVRQHLGAQLASGSATVKPWAALALAVLERGLSDHGASIAASSALAVRSRLAEAGNVEELAGAGLAAGLMRDTEAQERLLTCFLEQSDELPRRYAALALGLLRAVTALEPIRSVAESSIYRPNLLRDTAIALGLLRDRQAVGRLEEMLSEATSLAAQASIAEALGRIGDARSIEPLMRMLADPELTETARAFAAVALGRVGDRDELPWNTVLAVDSNYADAPATLLDFKGLGVLNIL